MYKTYGLMVAIAIVALATIAGVATLCVAFDMGWLGVALSIPIGLCIGCIIAEVHYEGHRKAKGRPW